MDGGSVFITFSTDIRSPSKGTFSSLGVCLELSGTGSLPTIDRSNVSVTFSTDRSSNKGTFSSPGVCLELLGIGGGLGMALLRSSPGGGDDISNKTMGSQEIVSGERELRKGENIALGHNLSSRKRHMGY